MRLSTPRLILRPFTDADAVAVAAMTADAEVMRFFPAARDRAQSDAWLARARANFERQGYGIWAVEAPGIAPFIGFCGLHPVGEEFPCGPTVEVLWTFARAHWRHGYASEAARAAVDFAFSRLGFPGIVAFTTPVNLPSQGVMRAIGMTRDAAEDFDHPRVAEGHPLRRHVLFRTDPAAWSRYWAVRDGEERLLQPEVRRSAAAVDALLAPDFVEFGSSGRVWDRAGIIAALAGEAPAAREVHDFTVRPLADGTALATYRATNRASGRRTLRSSIWQLHDGQWRIRFHQGTLVSPEG